MTHIKLVYFHAHRYTPPSKRSTKMVCLQFSFFWYSIAIAIAIFFPLVKIFEYDRRFASYGDDFVYYDFNEADNPECLQEFQNYFDLVIVDPPFLSEECMKKISTIVKKVVKADGKIIFCSGEVCEPWITTFLQLKKCNFKPEHDRNLGNEFASYSNFDIDKILKNTK